MIRKNKQASVEQLLCTNKKYNITMSIENAYLLIFKHEYLIPVRF